MTIYVTGYGWRYRRHLRALVVRPRSREVLDRLGLIVRVIYVEDERPYYDQVYYNGFDS